MGDQPLVAHRHLGEADLAGPAEHRVEQFAGTVRVGEAHGHARMDLPEGADERGDGVDGERGKGHEVEASGDEPGHGGDLRPHGLDRPQRLARRGHERLAGRGETNPPSDAGEQFGAELALELAHRLGQRRLGDEARRRGGGERALIDHRHGVAQLVQLHR